jgi:hypothetical protein
MGTSQEKKTSFPKETSYEPNIHNLMMNYYFLSAKFFTFNNQF